MTKVSVIIPVYNAEKYLEKCLESFLAQTLRDFEIICVDDESTDGSSAILERFAARDKRIRIIRQSNAGAAVARNTGIDAATGDYLYFSDADDFCDAGMLEALVEKADELSADCVIAGNYIYDEADQADIRRWQIPPNVLSIKQPFTAAELSPHSFDSVRSEPWNKLFRASFIREESIRFQKLFCANDVYFVCMAIATAKRIGAINKAFYHYRTNTGAGLVAKSAKAPLAFFEARKAVHDELIARGREDLLEDSWNAFVRTATWRLMNLHDPEAFRRVYEFLHSEGFAYFHRDGFSFESVTQASARRRAETISENADPVTLLLEETWAYRNKLKEIPYLLRRTYYLLAGFKDTRGGRLLKRILLRKKDQSFMQIEES